MPKNSIIIDPKNLIFAMDMGTRSVIGLVCCPENDKLKVLAVETAAHPQRDMLDGQIHNIEGVAMTAKKVKKRLEKELGVTLKNVALAAAGRALKTFRSRLAKKIEPGRGIQAEEVSSLELKAVEKARELLLIENGEKTNAGDSYYCVGFSTVAYYLDGYPISSLLRQKGKKMEVEVLATFLPQIVIDSLLTVVEELGLSVSNLTLEPIAALNVTIPLEYRSLNLALVDVGAGTSDIAITHKGAVIGYAMVPLGGDEITEQIAENYLLDFNTAEKIKLASMRKKNKITFKDILGNRFNLTAKEIIKTVEPVIDKIALEIANAIIENNGGPTRAVFCIGGGSRTLLLQEKLAEKLNLPLNMVVARGREVVNQVLYKGRKLAGPESITPLGIAVSAMQKGYFGFNYITVNEKVIRLLDTENLKVSSALIAASFPSQKLLGQRGPSLHIFLDGKEKIIPGTPGEHAQILVNGKKASLETLIKNNDKIEITAATEGSAPVIKVADLFPPEKYYVYFNTQKFALYPHILVNKEKAAPQKILKEGDRVDFKGMGTLGDFITLAELDPYQISCLVNEEERSQHYRLQVGDKIVIKLKDGLMRKNSEDPTQKGIPDIEKSNAAVIKISVNGRQITLDGKKDPLFVDVFDHIDIDRSKPQGRLVLTQNGQPTSLTAKLADGDEIFIYWEENK